MMTSDTFCIQYTYQIIRLHITTHRVDFTLLANDFAPLRQIMRGCREGHPRRPVVSAQISEIHPWRSELLDNYDHHDV